MSNSTIFNNLKVWAAEQLIESVSEPTPNTKLYFTYGKTDAWSDDTNPPAPNKSVYTTYEIFANMIGAKRLLGGDIQHVIPRYQWSSGEKFVAYDDKNPELLESKFYCVNDEYSVYKCISNNSNSISTVQPTSLSPYVDQITSDGYTWKYMYTVSDADILRFTTSNYIPVRTLSEDNASLQWSVQTEAKKGSINSIFIENAGGGYANASTLSIVISGDGQNAKATALINSVSNTISSIRIINFGSGYTYATASIIDANTVPGTGAVIRPIISPPGGHGSNPVYELGASNVMINARLKYDEQGVLPVSNDYRQIAIIKDPFTRATSNVEASSAFVQAFSATCAGFGNYLADEIVYQGPNLQLATFTARVVSWNTTTNKIILINTIGTLSLSQALLGTESFTGRIVTSLDPPKIEPNSGQILWVENIKPIIRSSDQIEDFKIVVKF